MVAAAAIVIGMYFWPGDGGGPALPPNPKIAQMGGLIAYWSFDEVKGDAVIDHSGHNNHLTMFGARLAKGVRGKGVWLDGKAEHFCQLPASNDFNFGANAPFSFAGWVKTPMKSGAIVSLTSNKGPQQIDFIIRDNKFIVVVGDDNDRNVQNAFVWSRSPNNAEWHHFVILRRTNVVQLWLDGALQGEMAAAQSGGPVTTNLRALGSERIWIANNEQKWGNPTFDGGLDEVCVFNRAIEPAEIQVLREGGR